MCQNVSQLYIRRCSWVLWYWMDDKATQFEVSLKVERRKSGWIKACQESRQRNTKSLAGGDNGAYNGPPIISVTVVV